MKMDDPNTSPNRLLTRQRLVALAANVISVVFAVLVALAIDQAWEARENRELGVRGVASVAAEVRSNLEVLENRRPQTDSALAHIRDATAALARNDSSGAIEINYPVALLSAAAWQTAQITRAVSFVDIERVIRIARVYDLQTFFLRNQDQLTDLIADMGAASGREPQQIVTEVGRRYGLVTAFRDELARAYRCLLIEIDDATPEPGLVCADDERRPPAR